MNKTQILYDVINDGQRAYRLKKSINTCPKYVNPIYTKAWKAGYRWARKGVSFNAVLNVLELSN